MEYSSFTDKLEDHRFTAMVRKRKAKTCDHNVKFVLIK